MLAFGIVVLIVVVCIFLKEKLTPAIPAEYWANEELRRKDLMDGVSEKEIIKRAQSGRYYLPKK